MKSLQRVLCLFFVLINASVSFAQVTFWSENWTSGGAGWTLNVPTGTEGADANFWNVGQAEGGGITPDLGAPGSCGVANNGNNTLHVTSVWNPNGGAAYDAGGLCGFLFCPQANRRSESPTIDCSGRSGITLRFNYIENGQGLLDNATVWYYDGSMWNPLDDPPKTLTGCGGQGLWTSRSIAMPPSADNNPSVKIAFHWINNDDGAGTDPSFAVDDIVMQVPSSATPVVTFTASDTTLCVGDCIDFTASATNGPILSWAWTFNGGTPGSAAVQNPTNICFNTAGTYSISLTATNGTGPGTLTKTNYIVVTDNPSLSVNPVAPTYCSGDSVSLTASGASTYSWSPPSDLSATTGATVTASPSATTTYTVTGTTAGCTGSTTVTVTVNPTPLLIMAGPPTLCLGDSDTLFVGGATSYAWTPSTGLSCTNCSDPIASPLVTTTYTVTGTTGSCSDSETITVTVVPAITANAGANDTVCLGSGAQLNASGGTSYSWTPATGLSCTNCSDPFATPAVTTSYTVTVSNGSCTPATDEVTIVVIPSVIAIAGTDDTICQGSNANLLASGGTDYSWTPTTALSCSNCANPVANPGVTTAYTVTVGTAGCTASDVITVYVDLPVTANAGQDTSFCAGGSVQLNASGGGTYSWVPATGLSCTDCFNPVANPATTTIYTLSVSNGVCPVATDMISVSVIAIPAANAGGDETICAGDTANLSGAGGGTYIWSPATGLSCTNCQSPQAFPSSTTNYTLTVNDSGCTATDAMVVTVNPAVVANAGSNAAICDGDSTQLMASGGSSYSWSPVGGLSCTNCADPLASPSTTTTYTVTVTNGSCSDTDVVTITVTPYPVAAINGDNEICAGTSTVLTASGGTTYLWSNSSTNQAITVSPLSSQAYIVTVTTNGCTDTASYFVNVNNPVQVNAYPDTSIVFGSTVQLHADGAQSWTWDPTIWLSCTNCSNPVASPEETITYTVTAVDSNGCISTDYVTITIDLDCGAVYVPNIFSPNNDGKNDVLYVRGNCIITMDFVVFDRWGEKVYESGDATQGWDGTFRGKEVDAGVFYYNLKATLRDDTKIERKGSITIVR